MLRFVAFLEHDDHILYTIWSNGVCDFGSVVCGCWIVWTRWLESNSMMIG